MNKNEFKAIKQIAEKLGWKSVNFESIKQMVRNQQALELDTVGQCGNSEETLVSISQLDADKIVSTLYVSSYVDLVMWEVSCFCDEMGIYPEDYANMVTYYNVIEPEIFEQQDYEEAMEDEYYKTLMEEGHFCRMMGWI